jgi:hypothetical protein
LHDEIGLRLTDRALTGDMPESQHNIFDWLREAEREIDAGRYTIAVAAARTARQLAVQRLRIDDEIRFACDFQLAQSLIFAGRRSEAEPIAREVWDKRKSVLPPDHRDTLLSGCIHPVTPALRGLRFSVKS